MRRSQRLSARETQEVIKQRNAQNKAAEKLRLEKQEAACKAAFQKSHGPEKGLAYLQASDPAKQLLHLVAKVAPRLLTPDYQPALMSLATIPWVRPLTEWKPKGKGRDSLFRSLASHLVALYPTPNIVWGILFRQNNGLVNLVEHLAQGGSLFKAVQSGLMPTPLTRAQCHDLLQTPGDHFMDALRRVQVRTFGGSPQLLTVWLSTDLGRRIHDRNAEDFGVTVLRWICQNPMLDRDQIGPLVDFIAYRRREDPNFSMKGRSALALLEAMRAWHGALAKAKVVLQIFDSSGFRGGTYETTTEKVTKTWCVTEILSSNMLAAEGKALRHCVYSYAWNITRGVTSIWSLTCDGHRSITIEVRNRDRLIVQARGFCNRAMTHEEYRIVLKWATENGLGIAVTRF